MTFCEHEHFSTLPGKRGAEAQSECSLFVVHHPVGCGPVNPLLSKEGKSFLPLVEGEWLDRAERVFYSRSYKLARNGISLMCHREQTTGLRGDLCDSSLCSE
ncbi:hypothetical protein MNBD_NITROSPINAE04-851 [hydrothermal vent metagenome]|uniref:Uncharacterized protein n=1 Tax=hydrothermal vent metagenome TaxID=652676 RepID=A0A3B1CE63_9ZZZZ